MIAIMVNIETHQNFRAAWKNKDIAGLIALMDDNIVVKTAKGETITGKSDVEKAFKKDEGKMKMITDYGEPSAIDNCKSIASLKAKMMMMSFNIEEEIVVNESGFITSMIRTKK
eukprot:Pgem_evm1s760